MSERLSKPLLEWLKPLSDERKLAILTELKPGFSPQPPKMRALTIGIDPGLSGAIAMLDTAGSVCYVEDLPIMRDKTLAWIDGSYLQSILMRRGGRPATAMIERVSAMPKQGVASSFQFGVGFGSILGVLQALAIPIEFVTPRVWKKSYGLDSDKKAALHKARLLYPDVDLHLAKHDGRAEALLIARYARSVAK
jgi:crossover junction endodeoxyribonuclease RuvC